MNNRMQNASEVTENGTMDIIIMRDNNVGHEIIYASRISQLQ
jgi:hypothetical protein